MKVIDLLNKIATKEIDCELEFINLEYDRVWKVKYAGFGLAIVDDSDEDIFVSRNLNVLNNEIEIIEEDKPIEKLEFSNILRVYRLDGLKDYVNDRNNKVLNKINELIEEINKLKKVGSK